MSAYAATALHSPMYLMTAPTAMGQFGMFDPIFELLDGEGGDLGAVLQSLTELGWSGVTI